MTKSLMLLAALLALCLPASAQDAKVCGAPISMLDPHDHSDRIGLCFT